MTDITDVINQISQRIIKSAYRDSKGAAWHTLHATPKGGYEYMITNTFYSGTSGIVFFLLQSLRLGKGTDIENLIILIVTIKIMEIKYDIFMFFIGDQCVINCDFVGMDGM